MAVAMRLRSSERPEDIIMSVNQQRVANLKEFLALVKKDDSAVLLHVLRGDIAAFIVAK